MPRSARSRHHRRHPLVHEVPLPPERTHEQYYSRDIQPIRRHTIKLKRSDEPGQEEYHTLEVDELRSGSIVISGSGDDDRIFLYPSQVGALKHVLNKKRPKRQP